MTYKATCPSCAYGNFQDTPFTKEYIACRSCGFEFSPEHQIKIEDENEGSPKPPLPIPPTTTAKAPVIPPTLPPVVEANAEPQLVAVFQIFGILALVLGCMVGGLGILSLMAGGRNDAESGFIAICAGCSLGVSAFMLLWFSSALKYLHLIYRAVKEK